METLCKKALFTALLSATLLSFGPDAFVNKGSRYSAFMDRLTKLDLDFTLPAGFKEMPRSPAEGKDCAIAFKNKKRGIETRYYLYSFAPHVHDAKCNKGSVCLAPEPEKFFKEEIYTKINGLALSEHYEVKPVSPVRCASDFSAQESGFTVTRVKPGNGNDYQAATILYIKNKTGGAIVCCLYRDLIPYEQDIPVIEVGLRFKE
jgi:hypothetical protein